MKKTQFSLLTGLIILNSFLSFAQTATTLTDTRDNKTYKIKTIGSQTWMAENLNYTADSSWCYNDSIRCKAFGRLYTWEAAKKACPAGWHLPSDAEFTLLTDFVGGLATAGGKLKEINNWTNPNTGATDSFGFRALPGGKRDPNGTFGYVRDGGAWWTSTEYDDHSAWLRGMNYNTEDVIRGINVKEVGFSVRCIRD
jgi:uncharacterized protein (TIGR02145 family)